MIVGVALATVRTARAGGAGSDGGEEDQAVDPTSVESLPQLTAARGGSLGLASSSEEVLQSSVDAQLVGGQPNAELFAKVGGLDFAFANQFRIDVFGETITQDIPRFLLDNGTVRREMFDASLFSAGLRLQFNVANKLIVSEVQPGCNAALEDKTTRKALLKGTVDELRNHIESTDQDDKMHSLLNKLNGCDPERFLGQATHRLTLGVRVLRRSPASSESGTSGSSGYAGELMYQYERERRGHGWGFFLGFSMVGYNSGKEPEALAMAEYPELAEVRGSAGVEIRGASFMHATTMPPRAGLYAVVSRAWWDDPYTFGSIDGNVRSYETEVGLYVGGKFKKNLVGMLALRFVHPLGTDRDRQFIISIIPSVTSASEESQ